MKITIRTDERAILEEPLAAKLTGRLPAEPWILSDGKASIPAQKDGALVRWIQPALGKNSSTTYDLKTGKAAEGWSFREDGDATTIELHGQMIAQLWHKNAPKPYIYPLIGPKGKPMTRNFPMNRVAGETTDHPHHRSMWFTHGDVNGLDYWTEGPNRGKIVARAIEERAHGPVFARFVIVNDWIGPDGKKACEDRQSFAFYWGERGLTIDFETIVTASEGDLKFGDTKEGSFGIRVASALEVSRRQGAEMINSNGEKDAAVWGKRAAWCDYSGKIDEVAMGIAIMDHPESFRHPTHWHARDYGLFAVNPFGIHDFVPGAARNAGDHKMAKGETMRLRYRIWLHEGNAQQAGVAERWSLFAHPPRIGG